MRPASGLKSVSGPTPVPDKLRSSSSSGGSDLCIGRNNDSTCGLSVPSGAAACNPVSGIAASQGAQVSLESVASNSSVPGPTRVCGKERASAGPSCQPPDITCPDIPDICSDTETIYSIQGYETGMPFLCVILFHFEFAFPISSLGLDASMCTVASITCHYDTTLGQKSY